MKEDILEQLVDDFLRANGYFTKHNIKFLPRHTHPKFIKKEDSNHSDIDVIGFNPNRKGQNKVWVVSCKSWQGGFNIRSWINALNENKILSGREAWKFFRELMIPKWSEAFCNAVKTETGSSQFTYITAVTRLSGEKSEWENRTQFRRAMKGNPIKLFTLSEMLDDVLNKTGTMVASSDLGRTLQLFKSAGYLN